MTVQEAIKELHNIRPLGGIIPQKRAEAIDMSIQALEEVEQYRALGTVEELKEAREKQIPKKPTFVDTRFRQRGKLYGECVTLDKCYRCPNCNSHIFHDYDSEIYCKYCGQALKWGEEDD